MENDDPLDRVRRFAARDAVITGDLDFGDSFEEGGHGTGEQEGAEMTTSEQVDMEQAMDTSASGTADAGQSPGALSAPGDVRGCPVPNGAVIFGELTSAFVDGPRLLRFLGERKHTGALVDAARGRVEATVLYEGNVVGLVSFADGETRRLSRLTLPSPSDQDEHELTVLTYRPEIALALGQLINLPERFERMHGSFVDFPALLSFLRREKASGGVRVTTAADTGIVLLRAGEVLGAYSRRQPDLDDADTLFSLAKASDAEIDVHVGALAIPPPSVGTGAVS